VRSVPGHGSPSIFIPINAATSIEITGNRFLHGWMQHRFESKYSNTDHQLACRARQFSCFLVILGTIAGPDKFEPKHAIILQNKDELTIPLTSAVLPSAKEFKDSIQSLSPEQQEFAKAYRGMQLESSVFGVCVIQLKPQLEKLLGLPDGALTKEIQLTQDLMSLFVDYQIPSDLLTFDGPADATVAEKIASVKGYVKSLLEVIDESKKNQLKEEERKADMRHKMVDSIDDEIFNFPAPPRKVDSIDHEIFTNFPARQIRKSRIPQVKNKGGGLNLDVEKKLSSHDREVDITPKVPKPSDEIEKLGEGFLDSLGASLGLRYAFLERVCVCLITNLQVVLTFL